MLAATLGAPLTAAQAQNSPALERALTEGLCPKTTVLYIDSSKLFSAYLSLAAEVIRSEGTGNREAFLSAARRAAEESVHKALAEQNVSHHKQEDILQALDPAHVLVGADKVFSAVPLLGTKEATALVMLPHPEDIMKPTLDDRRAFVSFMGLPVSFAERLSDDHTAHLLLFAVFHERGHAQDPNAKALLQKAKSGADPSSFLSAYRENERRADAFAERDLERAKETLAEDAVSVSDVMRSARAFRLLNMLHVGETYSTGLAEPLTSLSSEQEIDALRFLQKTLPALAPTPSGKNAQNAHQKISVLRNALEENALPAEARALAHALVQAFDTFFKDSETPSSSRTARPLPPPAQGF